MFIDRIHRKIKVGCGFSVWVCVWFWFFWGGGGGRVRATGSEYVFREALLYLFSQNTEIAIFR